MYKEEKVDNATRVSDILEQISALNELIQFQKANNAPASTTHQYEFMRNEFLEELRGLLETFRLRFQGLEIAA
jgi:hypothetical protein